MSVFHVKKQNSTNCPLCTDITLSATVGMRSSLHLHDVRLSPFPQISVPFIVQNSGSLVE